MAYCSVFEIMRNVWLDNNEILFSLFICQGIMVLFVSSFVHLFSLIRTIYYMQHTKYCCVQDPYIINNKLES